MSGTRLKTVQFAIVLILAAVLGGVTTYFSMRDQVYTYEYTSGTGAAGSALPAFEVMTAAEVKIVNKELAGIAPQHYNTKVIEYSGEALNLSEYAGVLEDINAGRPVIRGSFKMKDEAVREILGRYSYPADKALEAAKKAKILKQALSNALAIKKYGENVSERAQILMSSSIISDEAKKKIARTGADFFNRKEIEIAAFVPAGTDKLCKNPYMDIFMLAAVILGVYIAFTDRRKSEADILLGRKSVPVSLAVLFAGLTAGFLLEIAAVGAVFGLGDPQISIQSVTRFKTSPYSLTLWEMFALRGLLKVLFFTSVYALCLVLARSPKPLVIRILIPVMPVILEISVLKGTAFDLLNSLHFEEVVGKYSILDVFGMSFSYTAVCVWEILIITVFSVMLCILQETKVRQTARADAERHYLDDLNEKYSQIRLMRHDMNNHLTAALMLLNDGKTEEAKHYLENLTQNMAALKVVANTGVKALDLLLQNKAAYALETGIALNIDFKDDFSKTRVSDYELCAICGNLIDNAFEAVLRLPGEERRVSFTAKRQLDMLCIYCENKYLTVQKVNGRYISTKGVPNENTNAGSAGEDTSLPERAKNALPEHGLGLKSVAHIAHKYGGTVEITDDDNVFSISVLMQG